MIPSGASVVQLRFDAGSFPQKKLFGIHKHDLSRVIGRGAIPVLAIGLQQFIQLFHFLLCLGNVLRPCADARLYIFRLSHYIQQVFLLFLKGKSTGLSGDPGNNDDALRWSSFPLLCDLKLDPVAGSIRNTDAVQEGSVYGDDPAPENG